MTTHNNSPMSCTPFVAIHQQTKQHQAKKMLLCLTILASFSLVSCTNPQSIPSGDVTAIAQSEMQARVSTADSKEANASLKELAIAVAGILENDDDRTFFHKKVLQKFDGDTDILWTDLEDDQELFTKKRKKWSDLSH